MQVVALLAEGVDRNTDPVPYVKGASKVALLAEGVDRNKDMVDATSDAFSVALLAEGVDRNTVKDGNLTYRMRSPSSRRAWIEIR